MLLWIEQGCLLLQQAKELFLSPVPRWCSITGSPVPRQLPPYRACALAVDAMAAVEEGGKIRAEGMDAGVIRAVQAPTVDQPGLGVCMRECA